MVGRLGAGVATSAFGQAARNLLVLERRMPLGERAVGDASRYGAARSGLIGDHAEVGVGTEVPAVEGVERDVK